MRLIDVDVYCATICRCNRRECDKAKCPIHNAPTAYDIDKVVRQLNLESVGSSIQVSLGLLRAIEIVKQGGVSDDVCEWKLEDEEANLYLTGCQQRQLIFDGTPKENGYRYCPYCGKKIKVVE